MVMDGFWRSVGYGWAVQFDRAQTRWFDVSPIGLIPTLPPVGEDPSEGFVRRGGQLRFREPCGLSDVVFEPMTVVPPLMPESARTDPVANFEVLWGTIADHHAFLYGRGTDWAAIGHEYRSRAGGVTNGEELLEVFTAMLSALGDGHVAVTVPEGPPQAPTSVVSDIRGWIVEGAVRQSRRFGSGQLVAGRIDESLGYLGILRMQRFTSDAEAVELEVAEAERSIDDALATLGGTEGIVIDLRGNTGGWDAVALRLLAPFLDRERALFSKCARVGTDTTVPLVVCGTPATGRRFDGPVAIMTGPWTMSAAEVFTLASLERPGSIRVGAATCGILSDELVKVLPNGWTFTVSNEIYRDLSGRCPEIDGVPPDVPAGDGQDTNPAALAKGLEVAVAALRDRHRDHLRR